MNSEHKYKDKDKYKDNDKDKDATRITVLFFRNPYDSSISRIMVDTSSWSTFSAMSQTKNFFPSEYEMNMNWRGTWSDHFFCHWPPPVPRGGGGQICFTQQNFSLPFASFPPSPSPPSSISCFLLLLLLLRLLLLLLVRLLFHTLQLKYCYFLYRKNPRWILRDGWLGFGTAWIPKHCYSIPKLSQNVV